MGAPLPVSLMLVEDERVIAFDLKRQLQNFGYTVSSVVASGELAVSRAADESPDLVVMDIHLEGAMDGIEAASQIRARHQIPVVFLTAFAEEATLNRALDCRPFGYLVKPCEGRELHATIQMALARRQSELAVEKSEARLKLALDAASLGVVEWHTSSNRLTGDGHLAALFGDRPTPLEESCESFTRHVREADRERVIDSLRTARSSGQSVCTEFWTAGNGSARYLEAHIKSYNGNDPDRIVGIVQDITQRHVNEEQLRQSSVVFQTTAEAIVITDAYRQAVAVNPSFSRITGFSEEEILGQDPDALLRISRHSAPCFEELEAGQENYWHGEVNCHRKNGEPFPAWQSISIVRGRSGEFTHYVTAFSDVTAIHAAQQKLQFLAHHDPLTGLPNRLLIDDRLEYRIEDARLAKQRCLLLFLDLDGFKMINDTLGHRAGDDLLRAVGQRFRSVLRSSDIIGRIGGDEFVILPRSGDPDYAAQLAQKILDSLRKPFAVGGEQITISGSLGIAIYPDNGDSSELLLRAADMAMYSAKAEGRNRYNFFANEMSDRARERLYIEQGLRRAIAENHLTVAYQPQIDLGDRRIVAVEALIRWQDPEHGLIMPNSFIPVAEETGVIDSLGRWVLQHACQEIVGLRRADGEQLRLAVNVSAHQFRSNTFVAMVQQILDETGFPAACLELEITESTLQAIERSISILNALKAMGVSISIDDFGSGYSSLSVLRDLPIDRVKIDRSFIPNLPEQEEQVAIVRAIAALGQALDMRILVEGIERPEQADALYRLGCQEGQGFLFSRPLTLADLSALVARQE